MANASIRYPAVAGMFYPSDSRALQSQVGEYLAQAVPLELIPPPKALVLPHAGYVYSGPVAATGYAALTALRAVIRASSPHRPSNSSRLTNGEHFNCHQIENVVRDCRREYQ